MYRSVVFALLLAGGCAGNVDFARDFQHGIDFSLGIGPPPPESAKAIAAARTVGIFTMAGAKLDKFTLQKTGFTAFGDQRDEVPIESWGIDKVVGDKIAAVLGRRFTVRTITIPKEAWAGAWETQEVLSKLESPQKSDLYIFVKTTNKLFARNVNVTGLGMIDHGEDVVLFANISVHLFGGKDSGLLNWRAAGFDLRRPKDDFINAPHRKLDRTWWPATPQAAVQSEKLKSATRALVEEGLADAIPGLLGMPGASLGR
jgi:hypothetical protein